MAQVIIAVIVPTLLAAAAAVISIYRQPGERLTSGIQHFAAGLVMAAVAVELVPEMTEGSRSAMIAGFIAGVAAMLGVKLIGKMQSAGGAGTAAAAGLALLMAVAVDLCVDGFLLGLTVGDESIHSLSLVVALSLEVGFLSLATMTALLSNGMSARAALLKTLGVILLFPIWAYLGYLIAGALSDSAFVVAISFATAALLYLVVEELLVEAHKSEDTAWAAALFFAGFLIVLLIE